MNKDEIIKAIEDLVSILSTPNDYSTAYLIKMVTALNFAAMVLHKVKQHED